MSSSQKTHWVDVGRFAQSLGAVWQGGEEDTGAVWTDPRGLDVYELWNFFVCFAVMTAILFLPTIPF